MNTSGYKNINNFIRKGCVFYSLIKRIPGAPNDEFHLPKSLNAQSFGLCKYFIRNTERNSFETLLFGQVETFVKP